MNRENPRPKLHCATLRAALAACLGVLAVTAASASAATDGGHTVKVLYAGSLAHVMEDKVRPAFEKATGDHFQGYAAGSTKLANEIKGKVRQGDVYVSAHAGINKRLMGSSNGDWVSWYATFMRSPLVIGYNPKSRFADALRHKPWYQVVTQPGFTFGRTDPKLDPKGKLIVKAVHRIADDENEPKLRGRIMAHGQVFPEEGLVGRLQAGQLDAGFFYKGEAAAADIPTVSIDPVKLGAVYTVTQLNRAPDSAGARDFIRFILGPKGRKILKDNGFNVMSPVKVSGARSAVPEALQHAIEHD
ncbi:extracellular solute-binding protein [Salinisphaera hydrothermalis]|uniref:Tungstate/molybdate binding protein n=1 Tax=Salinisphaera hydrothermalis (strain C41B8) TaxID=1304275 RepID=A0A084ILE3_SALHC|nr:extracellular solute-binding protein [Salinisphaera hydrothermalis]KEZ77527.1 tungstate/molybdate binding protein [Salinisphaera hydrothermalis C41B8]